MGHFLLLHLEAPIMSWGSQTQSLTRGTDLIPTRSGVGGLIANSLGLERNDPKLDRLLQQIRVSVKVLIPGNTYVDYHNIHIWDVTPPVKENKKGELVINKALVQSGSYQDILKNMQSWRTYLTHAAFQVALEVLPGQYTAEEILAHLKNPVRPLYLGRKRCLPAFRVCVDTDQVHERESAYDLLLDKELFVAMYANRNMDIKHGRLTPVSYQPLPTLYLDTKDPPTWGMNTPHEKMDACINNRRRSFTSRVEHIWNPPLTLVEE